jgi:hypothetical protein
MLLVSAFAVTYVLPSTWTVSLSGFDLPGMFDYFRLTRDLVLNKRSVL